ncbi:MAG: D-2-hydroxyacid dehydrogenase [Candidatus Dormibacteria bacterium]
MIGQPRDSAVRCMVVGRFPEPDLPLVLERARGGRVELVVVAPGEEETAAGSFDCIWRLFYGHEAAAKEDPLPGVLRAHPEVKWIHTVSAGVDRIGDILAERPEIILTNSVGVTAIPIAEFVVGCLLQHCKRYPEIWAAQQMSRWESLALRELGDLRVVIVGLGAIGQEVALRLAPFGCRVTGIRRHPKGAGLGIVDDVRGPDQLAQACEEADALVLAVPLTTETRGLVGAEVLSRLQPGACVINIARGGLIEETELVKVLASGRLAAAYLDAFEEEPLPPSSPLWSSPGVFLSPHLSWSSPNFTRRTCELFGDQLRRFSTGEPLVNQVDLRAGY